MDSYNSPTTKPLFKGTQIVWYLLSVLEVILAFRFALKLIGANTEAGFTNVIYTLSWPFITPFIAVFPGLTVAGSVFEWTTLLAMFVYLMIAHAIIQIFIISKTVSTREAAEKLEK